MKTALITGILWQDWPYLAKLLLEKWYKVYGLIRRYSNPNFSNTDYLWITDKINFITGDLSDECSLINVIKSIKPDEVYNLGAQSFVWTSRDLAKATTETNSLGVLYLLNAIKLFSPLTKFYQASTSEMFGNRHDNWIQTEETPFHPRSPYAIAKLYAYWMTNNFKESYWMFCCNWILFNHESPIRWIEFVTRKITDGIAKIKFWIAKDIKLWNLDSKRDRGFAWDYVEAMWLMLQAEKPDNYIVSTGETHSIRDFLEVAFNYIWIKDREKYVKIDPSFNRPAELFVLQGKSDKAKEKLWRESKVKFKELVEMMMEADLKRYSEIK